MNFKIVVFSSTKDKKKEQPENKSGLYEGKKKGKSFDYSKSKDGELSQSKSNVSFICNGLYVVRKCPKREKLSTLFMDEVSDSQAEISTRVNPLQLVNALTKRAEGYIHWLMYGPVGINGEIVMGTLDTSATNNFVSLKTLDKLGLKNITLT